MRFWWNRRTNLRYLNVLIVMAMLSVYYHYSCHFIHVTKVLCTNNVRIEGGHWTVVKEHFEQCVGGGGVQKCTAANKINIELAVTSVQNFVPIKIVWLVRIEHLWITEWLRKIKFEKPLMYSPKWHYFYKRFWKIAFQNMGAKHTKQLLNSPCKR